MNASNQEIEWQFEATRLDRVEEWLRQPSAHLPYTIEHIGVKHQVDTYCDTLDWRILRAGYALRVRQVGSRAEATLKSLASNAKGARQRRELTEPLPRPTTGKAQPLERLHAARGEVGARVQAVIGAQSLRVLFSSRTTRRMFRVHLAGAVVAEVALDETMIPTPAGRAELRRVEVELVDASLKDVKPFVTALRKACKCKPARLTKFETGLQAHDLTDEATAAHQPDYGSLKLKRSLTIGELALVVLRKRAQMLYNCDPGACLGDDPEQVHKMRVATRSMRAALRLFKGVLPPSLTALADEVKWLGGILGGVRDADVMTERVSNWRAEGTEEARDTLLNVLAERRAAARPVLLEGLHSQRYARLMETLGMSLRAPSDMPPAADEAALDALPRLLARYYRRMRKPGDTLTPQSTPVEYHQLRILVKRVRYSLEYVRPLYGTAVRHLLQRAKAMQQLLGNHHDAYVAGAWLHGLPANEAIGFHYGQLAQSWLDHAEALLKKFPRAYAAMQGSAWRNVKREIEKKQ